MYRDYGPKGVKFIYIYKSLAHPEMRGNYVQPFTLDERLAHARQAGKQLGSTIPWLVDPMAEKEPTDAERARLLVDTLERHVQRTVDATTGKSKRSWAPGALQRLFELIRNGLRSP